MNYAPATLCVACGINVAKTRQQIFCRFGELFCETHYYSYTYPNPAPPEIKPEVCSGCFNQIDPNDVTLIRPCQTQIFHKACLKCDYCGFDLSNGQQYIYSVENKLKCVNCCTEKSEEIQSSLPSDGNPNQNSTQNSTQNSITNYTQNSVKNSAQYPTQPDTTPNGGYLVGYTGNASATPFQYPSYPHSQLGIYQSPNFTESYTSNNVPSSASSANFLSQNSTGNCSQNSTQSTNYNQAAGFSQQQTYAQSAYQQQFQQSSYQQAVYLAAVGAGSVMGRGAKKQKRIFESFRKGPNKNKMIFFSCVCLVFHYS